MEHAPQLIAVLVYGLILLCREYPIIPIIAGIIVVKMIIAKLRENKAEAATPSKKTYED